MSALREEALKMHKENRGKLGVHSKVSVQNAKDLSLAYSPWCSRTMHGYS